MVGLSGLEPPTSRLSGVRSNQLSYRPISIFEYSNEHSKLNTICQCYSLFIFFRRCSEYILRKEVIQPHLPMPLACYYFTPIICTTFGGQLPNYVLHGLLLLQTLALLRALSARPGKVCAAAS